MKTKDNTSIYLLYFALAFVVMVYLIVNAKTISVYLGRQYGFYLPLIWINKFYTPRIYLYGFWSSICLSLLGGTLSTQVIIDQAVLPQRRLRALIYLLGIWALLFVLYNRWFYHSDMSLWEATSIFSMSLFVAQFFIYGLGIRLCFFGVKQENKSVVERYTDKEKDSQYGLTFAFNKPVKTKLKNQASRFKVRIPNPFAGLLFVGLPGSGKSYMMEEAIRQLLAKRFSLVLYDYKFPTQTKMVQYYWNKYADTAKPFSFTYINFDDPRYSFKTNPVHPAYLSTIEDAHQIASLIAFNLNKDSIQKEGDFFTVSPISYLTCILWHLRTFQHGKYCTLAHLIKFASQPSEVVIPIICSNEHIQDRAEPFREALEKGAVDQLSGQTASLQIAISKLASKKVFFVLNTMDKNLDVNSVKQPGYFCIGNEPTKDGVLAAPISAILAQCMNIANQKNKNPLLIAIDELPTLFLESLGKLVAVARSNRVVAMVGIQDLWQLITKYGEYQANAIFNVFGTKIAGQCTDKTAQFMTSFFPTINASKDRSLHTVKGQVSVNITGYKETIVDEAMFANFSAGTMAGIIKDDFQNKVKDKHFHGEFSLSDALAKERKVAQEQSLKRIHLIQDPDALHLLEQFKQAIEKLDFVDIKTENQGANWLYRLIEDKEDADAFTLMYGSKIFDVLGTDNQTNRAVMLDFFDRYLFEKYDLLTNWKNISKDVAHIITSCSPSKKVSDDEEHIVKDYFSQQSDLDIV